MKLSFYNKPIKVMKSLMRFRQNYNDRPIFIFSCGGREDQFSLRKQLREFIESKDNLRNVLCLKAEDVSRRDEFKNVNLLLQEAMMADVADLIIVFSESAGSFCELGAFTSLPHIRAITSVVEDIKYSKDNSFLNYGPIRMIASEQSELSNVFYTKQNNIMMSDKLTSFIFKIRDNIRNGYNIRINEKRMVPNVLRNNEYISIGPLVHEIIDLVSLLGPISSSDLFYVYCQLLNIKSRDLRIESRSINADMKSNELKNISKKQVIAFMLANHLLDEIPSINNQPTLYFTRVPLDTYFMFSNSDVSKERLCRMKAEILGQKRHMGMRGARCVYHKDDQF